MLVSWLYIFLCPDLLWTSKCSDCTLLTLCISLFSTIPQHCQTTNNKTNTEVRSRFYNLCHINHYYSCTDSPLLLYACMLLYVVLNCMLFAAWLEAFAIMRSYSLPYTPKLFSFCFRYLKDGMTIYISACIFILSVCYRNTIYQLALIFCCYSLANRICARCVWLQLVQVQV